MVVEEIFLVILGGFFVFWGWQIFRHHPQMFKPEYITKSMGTLAVVAIFLMVVVILGILTLNAL